MPNRPTKTVCQHVGCPNLGTHGWCAKHRPPRKRPDAHYQDNRPGASKRGYDKKWYGFAQRYISQHRVCARCGRPAEVADHIVPIWAGGGHCDEDNTQPLCRSCNAKKAVEDKEQYERVEPEPIQHVNI